MITSYSRPGLIQTSCHLSVRIKQLLYPETFLCLGHQMAVLVWGTWHSRWHCAVIVPLHIFFLPAACVASNLFFSEVSWKSTVQQNFTGGGEVSIVLYVPKPLAACSCIISWLPELSSLQLYFHIFLLWIYWLIASVCSELQGEGCVILLLCTQVEERKKKRWVGGKPTFQP